MASLRDITSTLEGSSILKVLKLSTVVTGDTIKWAIPMKDFMYRFSTADAGVVAYSATTQLFTITVSNTPDITIWILL